MALQKSKTLPNGDTVTYWKWLDKNNNRHELRSHYVLGGWESKTKRDEFPQFPKTIESFDWTGNDYPFTLEELSKLGSNDENIAYSKAKESKLDQDGNETNWFADARDLLDVQPQSCQ